MATYTITSSDVWTPESNNTYILKPGYFGNILFASALQQIMLRAQYPGTAFARCISSYDNQACSDITIQGMCVTNALVDGIRFVNGTRILIRRCQVTDCENNGIGLHGNTDSQIIDCFIAYNGEQGEGEPPQTHGIYAGGSGLVIDNCTLDGNSGWGVHLWPDAIKCVVTGNRIFNHPNGAGIVYQRSDGDASKANIVANNIVHTALNGVQIRGGAGDHIRGNRFKNVTWGMNAENLHGLVYSNDNTGGPVHDPGNKLVRHFV